MNAQEKMAELLKKYATLVAAVIADHRQYGAIGKGHDFYHAYRVAFMCLRIGDNISAELVEMAGVGSLIHNTDHLFGENTPQRLDEYLAMTDLPDTARWTVKEAVVNHCTPKRRYSSDDSTVKVLIADADKLVNLELDLVMRSAQFLNRLPLFDPRFVTGKDPEANYKNPKTILHDIKSSLEWVDDDWFRIPVAKKMAEERAYALRNFVDNWAKQLEEGGVLTPSYPEALIG